MNRAVGIVALFAVLMVASAAARAAERDEVVITTSTGLIERGVENLRKENYEEAVEDLKRARAAAPENTAAAYFLGLAYKKTQDYEKARENLVFAVEKTPQVKEAVVELADVQFLLEEYEEAISTLDLARSRRIKPAETAFLRGLVLARLGRHDEAIESLMAARELDPGLANAADYQIGTISLAMGRLRMARKAFEETVIRDPNSDLAQFANQYLETIERRIREERPLRFTAGLRYQYDDNVLLKPGDETVAGDVTNEGDYAVVTTFRGEYSTRLSPGVNFTAQYSFYMADYRNLSSHDVVSNTVAVSPSRALKNSSVGFTLSYNNSMVDDRAYLQTVTFEPAWSVALGQGRFARLSAFYQKKEHMSPPVNVDEDRDSDNLGAGAAWYRFFSENRGVFTARYVLTSGDTDGANWKYIGNTFGADLAYPATEMLRLNAGVEANFQNFSETHTVFGVKRKDRTYGLNLIASYALTEDLDLLVQYTYLRGDSNIAVYDYDKYQTSAGVEIRF